MRYKKDFVNYFSKKAFFTADDAKRYLIKNGGDSNYAKLLLHGMVNQGTLFRLKKGVYSFSENELLAGFAFRPFYYGLEFALTLRKIWTQQSNPVVLTTSKANPGIRKVMNSRVMVRRIDERAFFGFEYLNYSDLYIPVSKPEKIIIDLLYYKMKIDEETISALMKLSSNRTVKNYASILGEVYASRADLFLDRFRNNRVHD